MIPLLGTCPGVDAQMFSKGGPQIPRNPQDHFRGSVRFKTFHKSIFFFIKVLRQLPWWSSG